MVGAYWISRSASTYTRVNNWLWLPLVPNDPATQRAMPEPASLALAVCALVMTRPSHHLASFDAVAPFPTLEFQRAALCSDG
jgi:hypothetical protein